MSLPLGRPLTRGDEKAGVAINLKSASQLSCPYWVQVLMDPFIALCSFIPSGSMAGPWFDGYV